MNNNTDLVSFQVSAEMVNAIVEKNIQTAIVAQLGNTDEFINSIVRTALHHKVDSSGRISQYSSDNKYDFLDVALKNAIKKASEEAIREWVDENQNKLKKRLKAVLSEEKNKKQIISSFLEAGLGSINRWHFSCNVNIKDND